jgi:hypothetical protein
MVAVITRIQLPLNFFLSLWLSYPNIWAMPHFQILFPSLCHDFSFILVKKQQYLHSLLWVYF